MMKNKLKTPDPKLWKSLENKANELLGLRNTKGSGNIHGNGDGIRSNYMNEAKWRNTGSISIPRTDWFKLIQQARDHGKIPIFTIIRPTADGGDDNVFMVSVMQTKDLGILLDSGIETTEITKIERIVNEVLDYILSDRTLAFLTNRQVENLKTKAIDRLKEIT